MLENLFLTKGSEECRLLAIAMTSPKEHHSENLEIVMRGQGKYNIKMYDTRIMDIDEHTVEQKKLTAIMKRCGMGLSKEVRLDTDDFMTADERRLSSMYTMLVYNRSSAAAFSASF